MISIKLDSIFCFRFDNKLKHYQLFYDNVEVTYSLGPENEKFTCVNDLVAKGLVTLYMESRAGQYLQQQQLYTSSGFQSPLSEGVNSATAKSARQRSSLRRKTSNNYRDATAAESSVPCNKCARRRNLRQKSECDNTTLKSTSPEEDLAGKTKSGVYFKCNVVDDLTPDSITAADVTDDREMKSQQVQSSDKKEICDCLDTNENNSDSSSHSSPVRDVEYIDTPYYEVTRSLRRYNARLGVSTECGSLDKVDESSSTAEQHKVSADVIL